MNKENIEIERHTKEITLKRVKTCPRNTGKPGKKLKEGIKRNHAFSFAIWP